MTTFGALPVKYNVILHWDQQSSSIIDYLHLFSQFTLFNKKLCQLANKKYIVPFHTLQTVQKKNVGETQLKEILLFIWRYKCIVVFFFNFVHLGGHSDPKKSMFKVWHCLLLNYNFARGGLLCIHIWCNFPLMDVYFYLAWIGLLNCWWVVRTMAFIVVFNYRS